MKVIAVIALVFSCSYLVNGKVELLTNQAGFDNTAAGEGNGFLPGETFIEDSSGGKYVYYEEVSKYKPKEDAIDYELISFY